MFAITRSPLASPSALSHAFSSSFPFVELARAVSSSAPHTPLGSPGGTILPQVHIPSQLSGFALKSPVVSRPSLLRGQTSQAAATKKTFPPQQQAHLQLKLEDLAFKGIEVAPGVKPRRRLSFVDTPSRGIAPNLGRGLEEASERMATMSPGGVDSNGWRYTIKKRVPTPYPKEIDLANGGYFDLATEGPTDVAMDKTVG